MDRRKFLKASAALIAVGAAGITGSAAANVFGWTPPANPVGKRRLGKTGFEVFPVIYGGVVSMNDGRDATGNYIPWAIEHGVNYFDAAPAYGDAEEVMGNPLKPYRKNIYLACKTNKRLRIEAEAEFEKSLQRLGTDYFDLYQLHALMNTDDVDRAFGPGGTMEMLVKEQKEGRIRKLGFSAHSEEAALKAMSLYNFDTVMFPVNWMMNRLQGLGSEVVAEAKRQDMGILAIKSYVHRGWKNHEEKQNSPYPEKSWYKPIDNLNRELGLAALRWAFDKGVDVIAPPGMFRSFSFCVENIAQVLDKPLSREEIAFLDEEFNKVKDFPFI